MFWRYKRLSGADGPSACSVGQQAWQSLTGSLGYHFCLPFSIFFPHHPSLHAFLNLSRSFAFLHTHTYTHSRPVLAVVLQQNVALIRHSAAGNYLHLFKLLFMPFVWRASVRLEVWTRSWTVIICFRKWLVCMHVCVGFLGSPCLNINARVYVYEICGGIRSVKKLAC